MRTRKRKVGLADPKIKVLSTISHLDVIIYRDRHHTLKLRMHTLYVEKCTIE